MQLIGFLLYLQPISFIQTIIKNEKRRFSSHYRPDKMSHNRLNCFAGYDTKRHSRTFCKQQAGNFQAHKNIG